MVYITINDKGGHATRGLTKFAAVLLAVSASSAALAAEDPILQRLQGEFIGQGTVRMSPNAEPERIYCKIANKLVDGGQALEQKGRCAVATNSGRIKGKIASTGQGRYAGLLDSPQTQGPAKLAGHAEPGHKIVFSAEAIDRFSRQASLSIISLTAGEGGAYRLVSDTLNPGTGKHFQTGDILFKPDKK